MRSGWANLYEDGDGLLGYFVVHKEEVQKLGSAIWHAVLCVMEEEGGFFLRKVEKRREDDPGGPDSQGRCGKKRKVNKHSRIVLMLREVRTQEFKASGE